MNQKQNPQGTNTQKFDPNKANQKQQNLNRPQEQKPGGQTDTGRAHPVNTQYPPIQKH
jgi:hypothetical protein